MLDSFNLVPCYNTGTLLNKLKILIIITKAFIANIQHIGMRDARYQKLPLSKTDCQTTSLLKTEYIIFGPRFPDKSSSLLLTLVKIIITNSTSACLAACLSNSVHFLRRGAEL